MRVEMRFVAEVGLFPRKSFSSKNFNYTRASPTITRIVRKRVEEKRQFFAGSETKVGAIGVRVCVSLCARARARVSVCARLERTINSRASLGQLRSAKLLTRLLCRACA